MKLKLFIYKKILKQQITEDIHTGKRKPTKTLGLSNSPIITTKTSKRKRIFTSFTQHLIKAKSPKMTQKKRIRDSIVVISSDISNRAVKIQRKAVLIKNNIQIIKKTKAGRTQELKTTHMMVVLITELVHKIIIRTKMHRRRSRSSIVTISKIIRTSHNSKIIGQTLKRVAIKSRLMKKGGMNAQRSTASMSLKKILHSILRIVVIRNKT